MLLALPSSGLHSNGFSLVRKLFDVERPGWNAYSAELGGTIGETLLTPTKIYVPAVLRLLENGIAVRGISHITGGGFFENLPRCLPDGLSVRMERNAIATPPIFTLLAHKGGIPEREMFGTFNMGVGMVVVTAQADADRALSLLRPDGAYVLGETVAGDREVMVC